VLAGQCCLEEAIVGSSRFNVDLLPAGKLHVSPHVLLGNGAWKSLMASIPSHYRYIVIDTPPVLAASEALVLAKAADASLVCAMCDVSRMEQVCETVDRLALAGCRPIGTVLNGVPMHKYTSRYGYYADIET
jgi:tyrosine-protein kinase Etk/Wzc